MRGSDENLNRLSSPESPSVCASRSTHKNSTHNIDIDHLAELVHILILESLPFEEVNAGVLRHSQHPLPNVQILDLELTLKRTSKRPYLSLIV